MLRRYALGELGMRARDPQPNLGTCARCHLTHENDFLHVAMEALAGRSSRKTAVDRGQHLESVAVLRAQAQALDRAPVEMRDMLSLNPYRTLVLFVAENFEHMHFEETVNCAALWVNFSDAEPIEIHSRLVSSLSPQGAA